LWWWCGEERGREGRIIASDSRPGDRDTFLEDEDEEDEEEDEDEAEDETGEKER
jgi:hypothetical protein